MTILYHPRSASSIGGRAVRPAGIATAAFYAPSALIPLRCSTTITVWVSGPACHWRDWSPPPRFPAHGFPVLRLRGDYLAIVTLGFGEIVRVLLLNNTEVPAARAASARSQTDAVWCGFGRSTRKAAGIPSAISLAYRHPTGSFSSIWWPCCWWSCRCLSLTACVCRWAGRGKRCVLRMRSPVARRFKPDASS